MGCIHSEVTELNQQVEPFKKKTLTVATLNYCGIMNSPLQFYCEQFDGELKELSSIFLALIPKYISTFSRDKFKWEFGKLDVKLRTGRYSTMFTPDAGVQNNKMIGRQRFQKIWDQVFEVQIKKVKVEWKEDERKILKLYDLIAYHCMVRYVFKVDELKDIEGKDAAEYLKKIKPFYQLSFLNEDKKLEKTIANFSKLQADIFFFQQFSEFFYDYLKNRKEHHIIFDQTKDTMIIAKKSSFNQRKNIEQIFSKLSLQQKNSLVWSDSNSYMCVDNYILICVHLSSKEQKNKGQIEQLKKGLLTLKLALPEYQIILGGDINSFLAESQPFSKQFNMFPSKSSDLTTIKKRTMTQGQFNKADKIIQQSKDKIISTLKMENSRIIYISGKVPKQGSYVPSNQHPFDHFVLVSYLIKRQKDKK